MVGTWKSRIGPRRAGATLVILGLSLISSAGAHAAGLGIRAAMLPAKEVPAGLHLGRHAVLSNTAAASANHVNVSVMTAMGRVTGYQAEYDQARGHQTSSGIFYLATHVVEYRSAAGAAKGFRYYQARNRRAYRGYPGFTEFTSPGGRAWAITYDCQCRNVEAISDQASERVGRYYVNVELRYVPASSATAKTATALMDRTVHLMGVVARRLQ